MLRPYGMGRYLSATPLVHLKFLFVITSVALLSGGGFLVIECDRNSLIKPVCYIGTPGKLQCQ